MSTTRNLASLSVAALLGMLGALPASAGDAEIDPATFVPAITNPWFPLSPGTTFVYESQDGDDLGRDEVHVTCDTKVILGVTCTVVQDRAWVNGILRESTHDWFAQDADGNVWYFGEDTETLDDLGNVTGTIGSWEAGVDGAEAGLVMLADPRPGISYRQEYLGGVAEDMAKVLRLNRSVSVPYADLAGCVVTKEWTTLSPGDVEHKTYASGIGLVLTEELQGGPTVREELTEIQLDPCN